MVGEGEDEQGEEGREAVVEMREKKEEEKERERRRGKTLIVVEVLHVFWSDTLVTQPRYTYHFISSRMTQGQSV